MGSLVCLTPCAKDGRSFGVPPDDEARHRPSSSRGLGKRVGRHGFSLLEMMFVFVLMGLLAGLVTVNVRHYLLKGKQEAARTEIKAISNALEAFYSEYNRYPDNDKGLAVLTKPTEKNPEPPLKGLHKDPWGHDYQYNRPGRDGPYEVICFGADGHPRRRRRGRRHRELGFEAGEVRGHKK